MNASFYLIALPAIPVIALLDYVILHKATACKECGHQHAGIWTYLPATALEFLLFLAGIAIGTGYLK